MILVFLVALMVVTMWCLVGQCIALGDPLTRSVLCGDSGKLGSTGWLLTGLSTHGLSSMVVLR